MPSTFLLYNVTLLLYYIDLATWGIEQSRVLQGYLHTITQICKDLDLCLAQNQNRSDSILMYQTAQ